MPDAVNLAAPGIGRWEPPAESDADSLPPTRYTPAAVASSFHSAVVGSMVIATSSTRSAGKPPSLACSRINSALGAAQLLAGIAQELDPLAHRVDIATALQRAGRFDEAVVRAQDAVERDPFDRARATLGWAYFLSGKQEAGLAELERAVSVSPQSTMWLAQLGEAHGLAGNAAKAREILRTLEERAQDSYVSPYHFAYVHTGLGDAERAMDWLERAVAERTGPAYSIKGSFLFAPLHPHPRFRALLRQMQLE